MQITTESKKLDEYKIGIGTWAWGDRLVWGYGRNYDQDDLFEAYEYCFSKGFGFFDTAEIYGQGMSEQILGEFIKLKNVRNQFIASKFMPFPWRLTGRSLINAAKASLERLGIEKMNLYQIHHPMFPVSIEVWMNAMAETVQQGMTEAVGVSNYNQIQCQRAADALNKHGIQLESNQLEFSMVNRDIEKNGLLKFCQREGIKIIAYSPLGMGLLSGKYSAHHIPEGLRGKKMRDFGVKKLAVLMDVMKSIANQYEDATPAQVAINWVIKKGAIPIPGVKNKKQAEENLKALSWELSDEDEILLDQYLDK